jgi:hypothetical protein
MRYIGSRWISCGWHCYTGEGKNHGLCIFHNLGAKRHCGTSTRRRAPATRLHSAVSTIGTQHDIWKLNLVLKRVFINNSPILIQVCLFIFLSMLMVVFLLTLLTAIHYRLVRSNKSYTTTPSSQFPIWQTASNYAMYVINTITNQGNSNSKL